MERIIEIKKQDGKSFSPRELVEHLSGVFGLREPDSIIYKEGNNPQSGTLVLRGDNYDKQQVGNIISSAEYTVVNSTAKKEPEKGLEDVLGGAR